MAKAYTKPSRRPKSKIEDLFGKTRRDLRWFHPVVAEFKRRFPKSASAEMAIRAGTSTRSAETWISKKGAPEGKALFGLMNSDMGDVVMLALTAGCQRPWAETLRRQIEIARILDQQIELDLRLKALQRGHRVGGMEHSHGEPRWSW